MSSANFTAMRDLLGKQVALTVSRDPLVKFTGKFLALTDDGEATLIGEDGMARYCWPALAAEETT